MEKNAQAASFYDLEERSSAPSVHTLAFYSRAASRRFRGGRKKVYRPPLETALFGAAGYVSAMFSTELFPKATGQQTDSNVFENFFEDVLKPAFSIQTIRRPLKLGLKQVTPGARFDRRIWWKYLGIDNKYAATISNSSTGNVLEHPPIMASAAKGKWMHDTLRGASLSDSPPIPTKHLSLPCSRFIESSGG